MKIAIMTQPLGKNYGGIMQAFALQKILKDMGHNVTTIDYDLPEPSFFYKKSRTIYRISRKIIGKYKNPISVESHRTYILKNTLTFVNENIALSEHIKSTKILKNHFKNNDYDVVVVGSDQTWRPAYSTNIYNYYLDFLKSNQRIKRIAYASSFGVDSWEYSDKETKKCAKLANLFDEISVREQSGIELCKKYLGVESACVLDPTLLLDKDDYLELISSIYKEGKDEGVFTYFLDSNKEKRTTAQLLAENLSTYTYSCQARKDSVILKKYTIDDYIMPLVENWLASFANASFVLTDSFHGMVFSIIFNKPFLVIVNKERGAARFESLLSQIGALDHLIYDASNINKDSSEIKDIKPLEKESLLILKNKSINFLLSNLSNKD